MKKVVVFFILFSYCVIGGYAEVVSYKYIFTSDFFSLKGKGAGGEDETLTLLDENKTPIKCVINHTANAVSYDWDYQGLKIGKKPSDFTIRIPVNWNWPDNAEIKTVKIWVMGDESFFVPKVYWNAIPMIGQEDNYLWEPTMLETYKDLEPLIYTVPVKKRDKPDEITIEVGNDGKKKAVYFCALEILVDTEGAPTEKQNKQDGKQEQKKEQKEEEPERVPEDAVTITFDLGEDGVLVANSDFKRKVNYVSPGIYALPFAEKKHYVFNSWELNGDRYDTNEALALNGNFTFKAIYDKAIYILAIDHDMKPFIKELYIKGEAQDLKLDEEEMLEFELNYGDEIKVVYADKAGGPDQVVISNIWLSNNEFCPKKNVSLREFAFDMPGADVVLDFSAYSLNDIVANRKMFKDGLLAEGSRINLDLKGKHIEYYDPSVGMYIRDATGSIFVSGAFGKVDGYQVGKAFISGTLNGTLTKFNEKSVHLSKASFLDISLLDATIDTSEIVVEEVLYDFDTYEGCIARIKGKIIGKWRLSSDGIELSSILISNKNKLGLDTIAIPSIFDDFTITGLLSLTKEGVYTIIPSSLQDIQGEVSAPAPTLTSDEEPLSKFMITPVEGTKVTYIMNGDDDWSQAITISKPTEIEIKQDTAIFYYSSKPLYPNSEVMGTFYYYAPPPTYIITLHNLNETKKIKVTANEKLLKRIKIKLFQDVKFKGWSYSKDYQDYISPDDMPTHDIEVYAIYEGWEDYYKEEEEE